MADAYEDDDLAAWYDALNPWGPSDAFYLGLVMSAASVLDVGCGTGALLHRARAAGHKGRLCGLDPADGMLEQARRHPDIEWVHGTLPDAGFEHEFDLIVMTGHAFQVFIHDEDVRGFLAAAGHALVDCGGLAFETRNPHFRAWEGWTPDSVTEVSNGAGQTARVWHHVESVEGELVTFTETFEGPDWDTPKVSGTTLRFLPAGALDTFLTRAGFVIHERYGDWDRSLMTTTSREIITIARRVSSA